MRTFLFNIGVVAVFMVSMTVVWFLLVMLCVGLHGDTCS